MRRHRFEPAALVMGLVMLWLTTAFVLDVCGVWRLRPETSVPLVVSSLLLVVATVIVTQVVRAVRGLRAQGRRP